MITISIKNLAKGKNYWVEKNYYSVIVPVLGPPIIQLTDITRGVLSIDF